MADESESESRGHGGRFDDWEQIAEVGTVWEAELICGRLVGAGLEAQTVDQSFELLPLTNITNFDCIRVVVPTSSAAEARRVLSEAVALPEDAEALGSEPEVPVPGDDEPGSE